MIRIYDDIFDADLVRCAAAAWPAADWAHWLRYDTPLERKATCEDLRIMPSPCAELLCRMLALGGNVLGAANLIPDASLRGGGMQTMGHGGHLDCHLDATAHAVYGWRRAVNAILFLNDGWREEWGGAFELWGATRQRRGVQVLPEAGRLVVFRTNDASFHGVTRPLRCPPTIQRKTLAVFWYSAGAYRARARFVGIPGEVADPQKDLLRMARASLKGA